MKSVFRCTSSAARSYRCTSVSAQVVRNLAEARTICSLAVLLVFGGCYVHGSASGRTGGSAGGESRSEYDSRYESRSSARSGARVSARASAGASASASGRWSFRTTSSSVAIGSRITISGDLRGVAANEVSVEFAGAAGTYQPESIRDDGMVIAVPLDAQSGPIRVSIRGDVVWTGRLNVRGSATGSGTAAGGGSAAGSGSGTSSGGGQIRVQLEAPSGEVSGGARITLSGNLPAGASAGTVQVFFQGVANPVRPISVRRNGIVVLVPRAAQTGQVRVEFSGQVIWTGTIRIRGSAAGSVSGSIQLTLPSGDIIPGGRITLGGSIPAGTNRGDVQVLFTGSTRPVLPISVSSTGIVVSVPRGATSGEISVRIRGKIVWTGTIRIGGVSAGGNVFTIDGTIAAGNRITITGALPAGIRDRDIRVRFPGVRATARPVSVSGSGFEVVVPQGVTSGTLQILIRRRVVWSGSITVGGSAGGTVGDSGGGTTGGAVALDTSNWTLAPSVVTAGTSARINGIVPPGITKGRVQIELPGAGKISPSSVTTTGMEYTVPNNAQSGAIKVYVDGNVVWTGNIQVVKADNGFFEPTKSGEGLLGNVYKLPSGTKQLPNLGSMTPIGSIVVPNLKVAARDFKQGFPGLDVQGQELLEWFAIRFDGQIQIAQAGEYEFELNSDDGSILYIDGKQVVENDGQHAPRKRSGKVTLTAGKHTIRIDYFQGPRYRIALEMRWKVPGSNSLDLVPPEVLTRALGPNNN